jgi:hypothetical protein
MFSSLSCNSISFATVTPCLVIVGVPKLFSMMALRPLGPGVGDHDPAGGLAFLGFALDDNPVVQWTDVHGTSYLFD